MSLTTFDYLEVHAVDHCNNNCRWCNNHSPLAPDKEYLAEEYFPWLDMLLKSDINFNKISIMGGEPFLHSDLISFAYALRRKYRQQMLMLSTNGFWLSEENIQAYDDLWKMIQVLFISLYPNLLPDLGGLKEAHRRIDLLRKRHPHLHVSVRDKNQFRVITFPTESAPMEQYCFTAECTGLRTDGVMARCGVGAYAHLRPEAQEAFAASEHMYFDLKKGVKNFWHWRKRWPLDACERCTNYRLGWKPWKAEKGVKRLKSLEAQHEVLAAKIVALKGDRHAAMAKLTRLVEKSPESKEAFNLMGVLAFMAGSPDKARVFLEKALTIEPDYEEARRNMEQLRGTAM